MIEGATLAAKLQSEGDKLAGFMAALAEDDWSIQVYADGTTWTVRSILAHLMTTERAFLKLIDRIRQGGPGVPDDFEIDRYNARQQEKTQGMSRDELLAGYREARAKMVELVAAMGSDDLERRGRHPYLGPTTLREMVKMIYIHNQTHYRDVRRALNSK